MVKQPWRLPVLAWRLAACWSRLAIAARRASRRQRPDAVLVGYLGHFDVRLARLLFRSTPIALDHLVSAAGTVRDRGLVPTSRDQGVPHVPLTTSGTLRSREVPAAPAGAGTAGGIKYRLMRRVEDGALRRADVVVVDTAAQAETLPPEAAERAVIVPVGASDEWFRRGAEPAPPTGGPLKVIFVGLFTPLHGTETIG